MTQHKEMSFVFNFEGFIVFEDFINNSYYEIYKYCNKKIRIAILANGGTFSCPYFIRTFEPRFMRKKMKIDKALS